MGKTARESLICIKQIALPEAYRAVQQRASVNPYPPAAWLDVSGIVVHADPAGAAQVCDALGRMRGVTVHAVSPEGKIVATVETASEADSAECFARIGALPGVRATAMAYHQIETDPDQEV